MSNEMTITLTKAALRAELRKYRLSKPQQLLKHYRTLYDLDPADILIVQVKNS